MVHIIVLIISWSFIITNIFIPFLTDNISTSLFILSAIAFLMMIFGGEKAKHEKMEKKIKEAEKTKLEEASQIVGEKVYKFEEKNQSLGEYTDFIFRLENENTVVFSCGRTEVIQKIDKLNGKIKIYHVNGIILNVEN